MNITLYIEQLDSVISDFLVVKAKSRYGDLSDLDMVEISPVLSRAKAAVQRIAGTDSAYFKDIESNITRNNIHSTNTVNYVMGSVYALKSDLERLFENFSKFSTSRGFQ